MTTMVGSLDGIRTYVTAATIPQFALVAINSSGLVDLNGAGAAWDGVAEIDAASGGNLAVRGRTTPGTKKMIASKAITVGTVVYAAASGKVSDASSGTAIGKALTAATANNDIIEVQHNN